jgi:hypothetical protein
MEPVEVAFTRDASKNGRTHPEQIQLPRLRLALQRRSHETRSGQDLSASSLHSLWRTTRRNGWRRHSKVFSRPSVTPQAAKHESAGGPLTPLRPVELLSERSLGAARASGHCWHRHGRVPQGVVKPSCSHPSTASLHAGTVGALFESHSLGAFPAPFLVSSPPWRSAQPNRVGLGCARQRQRARSWLRIGERRGRRPLLVRNRRQWPSRPAPCGFV